MTEALAAKADRGVEFARWPAASFAMRALAVGLCAMASVLALVFLVPEGNDYGRAFALKQARLMQPHDGRIVLIGGSNLGFGLDSEIIERRTACRAVNMGVNGYLGLRYMLAEARPHLRAGDIVVVALEHDNFVKSVDGSGPDLLMAIKARPQIFAALSWGQRVRAIGAAPYVAQQKILRVLRDGFAWASGLLGTAEGGDAVAEIAAIERRSRFNEQGDMISHLSRTWPHAREEGLDLTRLPIDAPTIAMLRDFSREMAGRQVRVVISYTPVLRAFYVRHRAALARIHAELSEGGQLIVPSPPSAFVYDESYFFDTVYHLNAQGRGPRTDRLVDDIIRAAPGSCAAD